MTTSSPPHETLPADRDVRPHEVTVGILTALPTELHAMAALIDEVRRHREPGDPNLYRVGTLPSSDPRRPHRVALLALPRDGTQRAATHCANMLRTFPNLQTVIMTGIAGGIPRRNQPGRHVRLGDIVVAFDGIVNYRSVRQEDGTTRLRGRQGAGLISNWLLQAAGELRVEEEDGDRRWERWLDPDRTEQARAFPRPPADSDVLYVRRTPTEHPPRPRSGPPDDRPRVHYGVIGSGDVLMVDEDFRDELAQEYPDMRAIEMEGSGIATSTAAIDKTWFMVRGVVDYCELTGKNDVWHAYAAYAAASYVRTLLETAPPVGNAAPVISPRPLVGADEQKRLDSLLGRVPPELEVGPVWQAAVPHMPEAPAEVLNTPAQGFHSLARLNADPSSGLHPAMLFLARLSQTLRDSDPGLAAELWDWVIGRTDATASSEALRSRLSPGSGPPAHRPRTGPLLLIEMDVDGIDRNLCRITPYLQGMAGHWGPRPEKDTQVPLRDAEAVAAAVSEMVADAERVWAEAGSSGSAGIEFVLPAGLLNLPVQWYPASPRLGQVQPLCIRYPVAVRSLERMREPGGTRFEWVNRWERLDRQPFTGEVLWGVRYQDKPTTPEAWSAGLSGDDRYVVVVLSESPDTELGRQELFAALAAGVPVILWDQRLRQPPDGVTDGLRRLIAEPPLLPTQTRAIRVEAQRLAAEKPDHYGRTVALLWDDPNRVVPAGRAGS
ncbi:VMAP-C domain-containing protein [Actinoplanes aureus]|uniref:Nucleoside phosphorylase domain-containing protein n=1 Tax=Actinoplanes aureus TaxID=2792083 RepID=A0A931G354_9ACTN|nr:hypothetical protein [Actinoplanes aureus]MBG0568482.1 hypothetical protein [Actinoplanes aureus]